MTDKEITELNNAILHCEQFIALAKELIEKKPSTSCGSLLRGATKRQAMTARYFLADVTRK